MSYTKKFENFQKSKKTKDITPKSKEQDELNEGANEVGNMYKVVTTIDVPTSLINAYTKKVKDTFDKDINSTWGKESIAEELVKFVNMTYLNIDTIHAGALTGDPDPAAQTQAQPLSMAQVQPQAQAQAQGQAQGQVQIDPQAQAQGQVQVDPQAQAQGQVQVNPQAQAQAQAQIPPTSDEFGEIQDDEEVQDDEDDETLPI